MIKKPALRLIAAFAVIAIVMATCLGSTLWAQQNDSLLKASPKMAKVVPPSPTPMSFVSDLANVLSAQEHQVVDANIRQVQADGLGDIGVAILPTINDLAPSDVALAIYRTWRIGRIAAIGSVQRNLGVLILIVPKELAPDKKGQCFIEVGRGSQGLITDGAAGSICRLSIVPHLKGKDYSGAIMAGVDALEEKMREDPAFANRGAATDASNIPVDSVVRAKLAEAREPTDDRHNFWPILAIFGATFFVVGGAIFAAVYRRPGLCPKCQKRAFKSKRTVIFPPTKSITGVAEIVGRCKACGFTNKTRETISRRSDDDTSSSSSNFDSGSSSSSSSSDSSSSSSSDFGGSGSSDGGGGGSSY
ncbi:MAG: TPM domain-containing protein [Gemmatimonadaceae bacterium]